MKYVLEYIFVADSIGLVAATKFFEYDVFNETKQRPRVADFGTNQVLVCDFLS